MKLFTHPDYPEKAKKWQVLRDLYDGDHAVLRRPEYLWAHELELSGNESAAKIRGVREQRSQYVNFIEPVLSRLISLFFRDEPTIDEEVRKLFGDDISDVTGKGGSLSSWLKNQVVPDVLLYGRAIISTDAPAISVANLAEQRQKGLRPYFSRICPLSAKDWQYQPSSRELQFLRYEYSELAPRTSALDEPRRRHLSRIISRSVGGYSVIDYETDGDPSLGGELDWKDAPTFESEVSGWDSIPIAFFDDVSWLKDVAPLALVIFNLDSCMDNIHLFQAHRWVFIAGNLDQAQRRAVAEYTINFLPEGSTVQPIEPVQTTALETRRARAVSDLFRVAFNQNKVLPADSRQVEGAETQQEQKEEVVALVSSHAEAISNLANRAIAHYARFKGKQNFTGKIKLNAVESVEDFDEFLRVTAQFKDEISQYPKWKRKVLEKVVEKQNLSEAEEILEELSTAPATTTPTSVSDRLRLLTNGG